VSFFEDGEEGPWDKRVGCLLSLSLVDSGSRTLPLPFGLDDATEESGRLGRGGDTGLGWETGTCTHATTHRSSSPASGFAVPIREAEEVVDKATCAGGRGRLYCA